MQCGIWQMIMHREGRWKRKNMESWKRQEEWSWQLKTWAKLVLVMLVVVLCAKIQQRREQPPSVLLTSYVLLVWGRSWDGSEHNEQCYVLIFLFSDSFTFMACKLFFYFRKGFKTLDPFPFGLFTWNTKVPRRRFSHPPQFLRTK